MSPKLKTALVWISLILLFMLAFNMMRSRSAVYHDSFEVFLEDVDLGRVSQVRVNDNMLTVTLNDTELRYTTLGVVDDELAQTLSEQGILIQWGEEPTPLWQSVATIGLPILIVLALLIFILKRAGGGSANIMSLGKTKARLISDTSTVTFADVGGALEAKARLGDMTDFLVNPGRWVGAGVRLPRGVLLEGPPGCGKTLVARAVAGEAKAQFYVVSASEFVEMFVGVGAARVRDTFEVAAKNAPAVIFIDELDAVGRRRGSGIGAAHDEREQTLNQLLVCMDGFEPNDRVVVLAATNRPDILDPALLRPGRFDSRIKIPELTADERVEVLRIHTRNKQGATGAELESLANEAAWLAVRRTREDGTEPATISTDDLRQAMDKGTSVGRVTFNKLDAMLVESTSQLCEPIGHVVARMTLADGTTVEGEVRWMDANFVKIRGATDGADVIIQKRLVRTIEALAGTELAQPGDVREDRWARRMPEVA
jgi:cell division protease FtsH